MFGIQGKNKNNKTIEIVREETTETNYLKI